MNETTESNNESGTLSSDDRTWGIIIHISGIFTGFLGPLIIWLIKKPESGFLDEQGKEALNFQITIAIAMFVSAMLTAVLIGVFMMPIVGLAMLILSIMAAVKVSNGEGYRYPLTMRLIK